MREAGCFFLFFFFFTSWEEGEGVGEESEVATGCNVSELTDFISDEMKTPKLLELLVLLFWVRDLAFIPTVSNVLSKAAMALPWV